MEVVCEATQSPDTQVRVAALQCLVKIMSLYYQYMEPYMGQALFPVSLFSTNYAGYFIHPDEQNLLKNEQLLRHMY